MEYQNQKSIGNGEQNFKWYGGKNDFKYLLFVQLTTEVHVLSYTSPAYPNSQYSLDINVQSVRTFVCYVCPIKADEPLGRFALTYDQETQESRVRVDFLRKSG